jgi:hypothetical protein
VSITTPLELKIPCKERDREHPTQDPITEGKFINLISRLSDNLLSPLHLWPVTAAAGRGGCPACTCGFLKGGAADLRQGFDENKNFQSSLYPQWAYSESPKLPFLVGGARNSPCPIRQSQVMKMQASSMLG